MRQPCKPMYRLVAQSNCSTLLSQGANCRKRWDKNHLLELLWASCPELMVSNGCPNQQAISCQLIPALKICMASSCPYLILQWASICVWSPAGVHMKLSRWKRKLSQVNCIHG